MRTTHPTAKKGAKVETIFKTKTYITRTLSDILPDEEAFHNEIVKKLNFKLTEEEEKYLFILLYSRYADSPTRYTNASLFLMNIQKEIMAHYPTVLAIIRDQKKMRDTSDDEFARGGRLIINAGAHNTANVSTDTREGLKQLDSQQINNAERATIDILMQRMEIYRSDVEDRFLNKFVRYFVQIIYPQRDLLFYTDAEEGDGYDS